MRFEKWQALGNDYVVLERGELPWELTAQRVRALCAPHTGIGSDGILLLSAPEDGSGHVAELRIFNPDGSEAELSGNGAREAVLYLRRAGWTEADEFTVQTPAGVIHPRITDPGRATIGLGTARLSSDDYPSGSSDGRGSVEAGGRVWEFQHVHVGNPQCAIEVAGGELEQLELGAIGPEIEHSELFPNRTNVSFWCPQEGGVRARIFERGVGETMSSGTGAAGAAVAARLRGLPSPVSVRLDGGELEVSVGDGLELDQTGEAVPVYRGELAEELVAALG